MNENRALDLLVVALGVVVLVGFLWIVEEFAGINLVGGP